MLMSPSISCELLEVKSLQFWHCALSKAEFSINEQLKDSQMQFQMQISVNFLPIKVIEIIAIMFIYVLAK